MEAVYTVVLTLSFAMFFFEFSENSENFYFSDVFSV